MTDLRVEAANPRGWHHDRPCAICDHIGDDHSVFIDNACLECDCASYMRRRLPSPVMISGWRCPICRGYSEGWGTERRRVGRVPWKRLVHIECTEDR